MSPMRGVFAFLSLLIVAPAAQAAPVLLISVDGMQPLDIIEADKRGIRVPNLRRLMAAGTFATGVRGSLPTVTYPTHTTIITGVWPVRHGIENNQVFDPTGKNLDGWHWYAEDINVPTLWSAVHDAKRTTASIGWPVTVGTAAIDYNIPDYWRARTPEDLKLIRALSTPGLLSELAANGAPIAALTDGDIASDEARARLAETIYTLKRPDFFTLHFLSLDEAAHDHGPSSPEAIAALQGIDAAIGGLVAKAREVKPDLVVAIVSDHGFARVHTAVNLTRAFADAGLLTLDPKTGKILSWKAAPWGRGSAAITLADPGDAAIMAKTRALLDRLATDPANGIGAVIDHDQVVAMGGTAAASFWIDFRLGFSNGGTVLGPMVQPYSLKGTHGYFPAHPEMWASFFIAGPGVPRKGTLGIIDQRDIAPTIAKLMGVALPSADGKSLF